MIEVEHKAHISDPSQIEAIAAQLGSFEKETLKEDIYFRPDGNTDSVPVDVYRLRKEAGQAIVTFKEKTISKEAGEVSEENEFEVSDAHAFFKFANRFGFEPFVVKRKRSRVYKVGWGHIELNKVEHLGHFVEIEFLCHDQTEVPAARVEIARLFDKLGVPDKNLEPRVYIQMIQEAHPVRYRFVDDKTLDWPFEEEL